ncbi:beta-glucosidase 24-like isoform X2 [Olea europaea var. sylvestris]|uniref:beta-glucosidase 24-like isoform X2 n=1 Tax=Olea europaea var. sylvestris TaxID=158386 RepID=UPI000C1D86C5|nr:beta-glucosidase 24-like isoform X2 [Olea europaea var. sylvestris]
MATSQTEIKRSDFPKDFIFGGATSAYQVEGAWNVDGKGPSNWDDMTEKHPDSIADRSSGQVAIDHYNKFKDDVALMKEVGLDSYRFSISWSRILPGGRLCDDISEEGIQFYNNLIDELVKEGIKPCATLFHWDVPQKLEDIYGGFLDHQIVEHFCEFAEICFSKFGNRVKHWVTLNEPWSFTFYGYVHPRFPPRRGYPLGALALDHTRESLERMCRSSILRHRSSINVPLFPSSRGYMARDPISELVDSAYNLDNVPSSERNAARKVIAEALNVPYTASFEDSTSSEGDPGTEPYIVAHNLILAHARAVNIYRKKYQGSQEGKIGMTNVSMWYYPFKEESKEDVEAASRALDFLLGWFVAPVITGDYPPSMRINVGERLPKFKRDEVALVKGSCDFLGINYYTARYAQNVPRDSSKTHFENDLHVDERTHDRYGKPIGDKGGSSWLYIVPEGIYKIMLYIKTHYNSEIFITENGLDELKNDELTIPEAVKDEKRVKYHKDHLNQLRKAIEDGVRLKGYFKWSFFDNFEWTQGYNVRFGVHYVNFKNEKELERHPKNSAKWWKDFLKN